MLRALMAVSAVTLAAGFTITMPQTRTAAAARARPLRAADEVGDWGVDNLFSMMEEADEAIGGVKALLATARTDAGSISFEQTMAAIEDGYDYEPKSFVCGEVASATDENQGSAKIFSFAKLNGLNKETTLQLFGRYYREDVLGNKDGTDHGNIRNFVAGGWQAVSFPDGLALKEK